MNPLQVWAQRHGVSAAALAELHMLAVADVPPPAPLPTGYDSESYVQSELRLEAPHRGCRLWRNNVGVLTDETGRPIRYGLANDSKQLNEKLKSHDLIGWRRVLVTPAHVGTIIAQFLSRECKPRGWHLTPGDKRGQAQNTWAVLVNSEGGDAGFATGAGTL